MKAWNATIYGECEEGLAQERVQSELEDLVNMLQKEGIRVAGCSVYLQDHVPTQADGGRVVIVDPEPVGEDTPEEASLGADSGVARDAVANGIVLP